MDGANAAALLRVAYAGCAAAKAAGGGRAVSPQRSGLPAH